MEDDLLRSLAIPILILRGASVSVWSSGRRERGTFYHFMSRQLYCMKFNYEIGSQCMSMGD